MKLVTCVIQPEALAATELRAPVNQTSLVRDLIKIGHQLSPNIQSEHTWPASLLGSCILPVSCSDWNTVFETECDSMWILDKGSSLTHKQYAGLPPFPFGRHIRRGWKSSIFYHRILTHIAFSMTWWQWWDVSQSCRVLVLGKRRETARGAVLKKRLPDHSETGSGGPGIIYLFMPRHFFALGNGRRPSRPKNDGNTVRNWDICFLIIHFY